MAELWWSLLREGKPTLEWVVRWSRGEEDPVTYAWRSSQDVRAMANVLRLAGGPWSARLRTLRVRDWFTKPEEQLRRLVPTPPSLEELLASRAERRR